MPQPRRLLPTACLALLLAPAARGAGAADGAVDFAGAIAPILEERCVGCHGARRQKGGLRLDASRFAFAREGDTAPAIVRGDSAHSPLFQRVSAEQPEQRMPASGKPLSLDQIELLRRWIDQGAPWPDDGEGEAETNATHWAYRRPVRPAVQDVAAAPGVENPIDGFVRARLAREGVAPAPEADRATLIRRASLDLVGLPPTPEEVDAFLADPAPDAFEKVVDRLLASPHYGEARARAWLDLARYADTNGYEKDERREAWRWRDWVIDAFNRDLPFDRFTLEQLAGDLLPDATLEQRIATGFHRNTMANQEGGIDPEEFRVAAVVDRVNTTATVWLGSTLGCAQCHDHKYDPFTQVDYYRMFALFNGTRDNGRELDPVIAAPTPAQSARRAALDGEVADLERALEAESAELDRAAAVWAAAAHARVGAPPLWRTAAPVIARSREGATLTILRDGSVRAGGANPARDEYEVVVAPAPGALTALRIAALADASLAAGGPGRAADGNFVLTGVRAALEENGRPPRPLALAAAAADFEQEGGRFRARKCLDPDPASGWAIGGAAGRDHAATFALAEAVELGPGALVRVHLTFESPYPGFGLGRFRLEASGDAALAADLAEPRLSQWQVSAPLAAPAGRDAFDTPFPAESGAAFAGLQRHYPDGVVHELPAAANAATFLERTIECDGARDAVLWLGSDDGITAWLNGTMVASARAARAAAADQERVPVRLASGANRLLLKIANGSGAHGFYFDLAAPPGLGLTAAALAALRLPPECRDAAGRAEIQRHYRRAVWPEGQRLDARLAALAAERSTLEQGVPTALVLEELPVARATHVLARGSFLQPQARVEPGVPQFLLPGDARNRADLARWLTSPENPLAARVAVNRLIESLFGRGLVATSEDFGTQGEPPEHPELLDWLAVEFVESGWSFKHMLRLLVTSGTYRQSSRADAAALARDPDNRLLARGPRLRVEAEAVRDVALAVSGRLVPTIGGPSAFPPQPDGVWASSYAANQYPTSTGPDRYRRGIYTFLKRTAPYPSLHVFDGTSRELTCPRRTRTNTPLQALTLLNDPAFLELAGGLAARMLREAGPAAEDRAERGLRLCVARVPEPAEIGVLANLFRAERAQFETNPDGARALVAAAAGDPSLEPVELAAWIAVANVLLNLDETITKG